MGGSVAPNGRPEQNGALALWSVGSFRLLLGPGRGWWQRWGMRAWDYRVRAAPPWAPEHLPAFPWDPQSAGGGLRPGDQACPGRR